MLVAAELEGFRAQRLQLVADPARIGDLDGAGLVILAGQEPVEQRVEHQPALVQRLHHAQGEGDQLVPARGGQPDGGSVDVRLELLDTRRAGVRIRLHVAADGQHVPLLFGEEVVHVDERLVHRDAGVDPLVDEAAELLHRGGVGGPADDRLQPGLEVVRVGVETHHVLFLLVRQVEARGEGDQRGLQVQHGRQTGRLDGFSRRGVAVHQEEMQVVVGVAPRAHAVGGGVGARLGERRQPGGEHEAVVDDVDALGGPLPPQLADAVFPALAAEGPDVDVLALDLRVTILDGLDHQRPVGPEGDEQGLKRRPGHDLAGQEQVAHVALVGPRDAQRLVEQVQHGERPVGAPLGEAGGVLEGVDGRPPDRDPPRLDLAVEILPAVGRVVEHAHHPLVQPARHLGARVDAAEAELRVGAHLGGLARLGHEALAHADHDGVIFGELAGQVPEALAQRVGRDRVGVLLDLVEAGLVQLGALAKAPEELGAERRHRGAHGQEALHAAVEEGDLPGEFLGRFAAEPTDLHVVEPQMEPAQDGPGVERPLGDEILLVLHYFVHASDSSKMMVAMILITLMLDDTSLRLSRGESKIDCRKRGSGLEAGGSSSVVRGGVVRNRDRNS